VRITDQPTVAEALAPRRGTPDTTCRTIPHHERYSDTTSLRSSYRRILAGSKSKSGRNADRRRWRIRRVESKVLYRGIDASHAARIRFCL